MRLLKLMTSIAAGACAFAVCNTRAQSSTTNAVTFSAVTYTQGATNDNGTITTYEKITKASHNTLMLLEEINKAVNTNSFSKTAKLVLISSHGDGGGPPTFAVIDGANFYDLSPSGYNIMALSQPGNNRIISGTQVDNSPEKKTTQMQLISVSYNDTGSGTGTLPLTGNGSLAFSLTGMGTILQSDTATNSSGIYTDMLKASIASMTGEGTSGTNPFVATGVISASGKGPLSQ